MSEQADASPRMATLTARVVLLQVESPKARPEGACSAM